MENDNTMAGIKSEIAQPGTDENTAVTDRYRWLKAAAKAASPGDWNWGGEVCINNLAAIRICQENIEATKNPGLYFHCVFLEDGRRVALTGHGEKGMENAAFIAAASPPVILDLIEHLERYEGTKSERRFFALLPSTIDVLDERRRQQFDEGWSEDHDDEHMHGELARAAVAYALQAAIGCFTKKAPSIFPWIESHWKPSSARRDLVKAAALILAEIERLDRLATTFGNDDEPQSLPATPALCDQADQATEERL